MANNEGGDVDMVALHRSVRSSQDDLLAAIAKEDAYVEAVQRQVVLDMPKGNPEREDQLLRSC